MLLDGCRIYSQDKNKNQQVKIKTHLVQRVQRLHLGFSSTSSYTVYVYVHV